MNVRPLVVIRQWIARSWPARPGHASRGAGPHPLSLASHVTVLTIGLVLTAPAVLSAGGGHRQTAAKDMTTTALAATQMRARPLRQAEGAPAGRQAEQTVAVDARATPPEAEAPPPPPSSPQPPPSPPALEAPPPGSGEGVVAIYAAFAGSPGLTWALRVAYCESRYDPRALNVSSGASGLFQFMPATWNAYFAGLYIWDPYAQARAARSFYDKGWTNAWVCK